MATARNRRKRWSLAILAVTAAALAVATAYRHELLDAVPLHWRTDARALLTGISVQHDLRLRMRDGTELASSLYLPRAGKQPRGTVLVRLPYDRLAYAEGLNAGLFFARHGYAVLVQDLRGTGASGGELLPWQHAMEDGVDTLDWIVRQPWSNGKVGSYGCSALGEVQLALARARHPAHRAMIPMGAGGMLGSLGGDHPHYGWFEGGVFALASGFGWFLDHGARSSEVPPPAALDRLQALEGLPVAELLKRHRPGPNAFDWFMTTPLLDPRWRELGYVDETDRFSTPALIINSWGDQTVEETLLMAEHARRQAAVGVPQHVVIAPGNHCNFEENAAQGRYGELEIPNAQQPYREWYLKWFDHWLLGKGDGLAQMPPYLYYMLGEGGWHTADAWPPPQARPQRWYLGGKGRANGSMGDGAGTLAPGRAPEIAGADSYVYDPDNPVPSVGGAICCTGDPAQRPGPADQRPIERREDVLLYTSEPLEAPLQIAGRLKAQLHIASSAPDTDFIARLVHVWPDGRATTIQEGVLRARYRDGYASPHPLPREEPQQISIDMRSIAYRLPAGHRLRLHITSSSFPRLERNRNTGRANLNEVGVLLARNQVFHGGERASYIELPILPEDPDAAAVVPGTSRAGDAKKNERP